MIFQYFRIRYLTLVITIICLMSPHTAFGANVTIINGPTPVPPSSAKKSKALDVPSAPGRLIVKFRKTFNETPDAIFENKNKKSFAKANINPLLPTKLDDLMDTYKVTKIRSLVNTSGMAKIIKGKGKVVTLDALEQEERAQWEEMKKQFPKRSNRGPLNQTPPSLTSYYVVEMDPKANIQQAIQAFSQDPAIESVEPDYILNTNDFPQTPPNDENYDYQQSYLQAIHLPEAWMTMPLDQSVVVAVVDDGANYAHPDLAANIWINPCEDLNHNGVVDISDFDGIDNPCPGQATGNGYIDDIRGYDFSTCAQQVDINGNCSAPKPKDNDPFIFANLHGTAVASVIGAVTNNGRNLAGVAPQSKIMVLKGMGDNSNAGLTSELLEGIDYAVRNGADVINNSWSLPPSYSTSFQEALTRAYLAGVVVVFASGNEGMELDQNYKTGQGTSKIITVNAKAQNSNARAVFSNYGGPNEVMATGENICGLDTQMRDLTIVSPGGARSRFAYCFSGTSFAAPQVAGLAALIIADEKRFVLQHPEYSKLTNEDINRLIVGTSQGFWKLINAQAAVTAKFFLSPEITTSIPEGINNLQPFSISFQVKGRGLSQAQLFYKKDGQDSWAPIATPVNSGLLTSVSWDVRPLPLGTYTVRVKATTVENQDYFSPEYRFSLHDFDPSRIINITNDNAEQSDVQISGDKMVWREGNAIYYYNIQTQAPKILVAQTASKPVQINISDDYIIWMLYVPYDANYNNSQLWAYKISTHTTELIVPYLDATVRPYTKLLDQNHLIFWIRSTVPGLFVYDLDTRVTTSIEPSVYYPPQAKLSGDKVIYFQGFVDGIEKYWLYDILHGTKTPWVIFPSVPHGFNERWAIDLYRKTIYDLISGQQQSLPWPSGYYYPSGGNISRNRTLYGIGKDNMGHFQDLYVYDLISNYLLTIASDIPDLRHPSGSYGFDISGNRIVWISRTATSADVFMYQFPPKNYNLTMAQTGAGTGQVNRSPVGTSCGSNCWQYEEETPVTLQAVSSSNSRFIRWTGAASCSTQDTCTVTINNNQTMTAEFGLSCGDGTVTPPEVCDGPMACTTAAGYPGTRACLAGCTGYARACIATQRCGDGTVNPPMEICDGDSHSCKVEGGLGTTTCLPDCKGYSPCQRFDMSAPSFD